METDCSLENACIFSMEADCSFIIFFITESNATLCMVQFIFRTVSKLLIDIFSNKSLWISSYSSTVFNMTRKVKHLKIKCTIKYNLKIYDNKSTIHCDPGTVQHYLSLVHLDF